MIRCASCSHDNPEGNRFCGACSSPLSAVSGETAATVALPHGEASPSPHASLGGSRPASSSAVDEGRFLPGTVLAARYRIVGLLGRGGMGEVYRATDLTLGQVVALKFLPETTARDERAMARFYNEVRVARQVTHPNVCRVYDIGEAGGLHYISMEYVDGEDLGSLLRRIGRLPEDKAVETARKICAGLAAAHEKGVLHRDLKPANIMIDGRGQVIIMDFGLAGLAEQVAADVRSGTPAYMSPEQLAGREVTIKSDIYALGLLLYEVFTGRRAFEASSLMELMRMQEQAAPVSLASVVKELDPAVERTIMRCLQPDPRGRPASALAVAAGLPGGDPVAAALAAGETPSPDLLAAAGETEGLQPRFALACLGAVFALLALCVSLGMRNSVIERSALDKPPEVLVGDAVRVIGQAGYTAKPVDSGFSFTYEGDFRKYLKQHPLEAKEYWSNLADRRPGLIQLWYRQSPRYLVPKGVALTMEDPPEEVVGMVGVRVDARGRLISFRAVPPEIEKSVSPPKPFDWSVFFTAAGLDMKRFQPAEPEWLPPFAFDQRVAWMGGAEQVSAPLRAEGASWNGRPIFFRVIGPWSHPYRMTELRPTAGERTGRIATLFVIYTAILGACVIARFHFGKGRVDRRGALRMALTCYVAFFVPGMLRAHHVAATEELGRFWLVAAVAAINPAVIWVLYLAIEPWVRRRWPRLMIGWNRLMAAGWRDPLVGRDVLYGLIAGAVMGAGSQVALALRPASAEPFLPRLSPLMGLRWSVAATGDGLSSGITSCLIFMFVLVLFRGLLRRSWIAGAVMAVSMTILFSLGEFTPVRVGANLIFFGMFSLTLLRFGMLAALAAMTAEEMLDVAPLTFDLSTWYGAQVSLTLVALAVAAVLAFRVSLGGRKLLGDESF